MNKEDKAAVLSYLSAIGTKGGSQTSKAKVKSSRKNIKKAHDAKRKYTRCPHRAYTNHAHRFSPDDVCYGCRITRADAILMKMNHG